MSRLFYKPRGLMLLAASGSVALLAGALAFQAAGYAPCQLCYWQRWPHVMAILLGAIGWVSWSRLASIRPGLCMLGAMAAATTVAIGVYHWGVEQGLWEGPASCSGAPSQLSELTGESLLDPTAAARVVMCDEVVWSFLGLSMAGWNAVLSFGLCCLWIGALRRI